MEGDPGIEQLHLETRLPPSRRTGVGLGRGDLEKWQKMEGWIDGLID